MTQFKALSLIQARNYVREKWGDEGVAKLQRALSPATRAAVYSEQLMATDRVDIAYCIEHTLAIDHVFGNGDGTASAKMIREITTIISTRCIARCLTACHRAQCWKRQAGSGIATTTRARPK